MSSWKKASKTNQKTHRERHQPAAREGLGLLEKKKDYKLRAENRQEKEETLKLLHKKALNKNPDEFYHHMINSKLQKGEHFEQDKDEELTPEQMKLMETQDLKYVSMKRTIERRKIERLKSSLHMIDESNKTRNKHIFFVDDAKDVKHFDVAKRLDTHPDMLERKGNRVKTSDLHRPTFDDLDKAAQAKMMAEREQSYKELRKRIVREKELAKVQRKMQLKQLSKKQRKGVKPKEFQYVAKSSNEIFKFKYERKK